MGRILWEVDQGIKEDFAQDAKAVKTFVLSHGIGRDGHRKELEQSPPDLCEGGGRRRGAYTKRNRVGT